MSFNYDSFAFSLHRLCYMVMAIWRWDLLTELWYAGEHLGYWVAYLNLFIKNTGWIFHKWLYLWFVLNSIFSSTIVILFISRNTIYVFFFFSLSIFHLLLFLYFDNLLYIRCWYMVVYKFLLDGYLYRFTQFLCRILRLLWHYFMQYLVVCVILCHMLFYEDLISLNWEWFKKKQVCPYFWAEISYRWQQN